MNRNGDGNDAKDENDRDAVVLTLRRKPSLVGGRGTSRKRNSTINLLGSTVGSPLGEGGSLPRDGNADGQEDAPGGSTTPNPWRELRPSPARTPRNRLDFDGATGVIMMPDDEWYDEEVDSSEYGSEAPSTDSDASDGTRERRAQRDTSADARTSSTKRHSTYYHHPERRKRVVPGAFD